MGASNMPGTRCAIVGTVLSMVDAGLPDNLEVSEKAILSNSHIREIQQRPKGRTLRIPVVERRWTSA
jgi:hypothetical protein